MSEAGVVTDRFWDEFKSDVAGTLSSEQRTEIDRVLDVATPKGNQEISDLRLSCRWFFIRLAWGPEKRSPERIKQEKAMHPVMSKRNAPMLASLFAGYIAFLFALLALATAGFFYWFQG